MNLYKVFVVVLRLITVFCLGSTISTVFTSPPITKSEGIFIVVVLLLNSIYVNITPTKQIVPEEELRIKFLKEYLDNENSIISDG